VSTWELDARTVLSLLLVLPLLVVIVFALVDILRRRDLGLLRKAVYVALVVFVLPATLLYLLSRPTSIVRHRERPVDDWRDELLARLEQRPGGPPAVGPRQEQLLAARVDDLRRPTSQRAPAAALAPPARPPGSTGPVGHG
jgi:hypothetical protein